MSVMFTVLSYFGVFFLGWFIGLDKAREGSKELFVIFLSLFIIVYFVSFFTLGLSGYFLRERKEKERINVVGQEF